MCVVCPFALQCFTCISINFQPIAGHACSLYCLFVFVRFAIVLSFHFILCCNQSLFKSLMLFIHSSLFYFCSALESFDFHVFGKEKKKLLFRSSFAWHGICMQRENHSIHSIFRALIKTVFINIFRMVQQFFCYALALCCNSPSNHVRCCTTGITSITNNRFQYKLGISVILFVCSFVRSY